MGAMALRQILTGHQSHAIMAMGSLTRPWLVGGQLKVVCWTGCAADRACVAINSCAGPSHFHNCSSVLFDNYKSLFPI